LPAGCNYTGFDIKEGDNVDVVGDAHQLSNHVAKDHFDAVYSISTFEHLLMPWKVAVEMNRVMKPGAIGFVGSHQAWPLHEEPWDFWRFSDTSWHAIFNKLTGFEIIEVGLGDRARIAPANFNYVTYRLDETFAYLNSNVLFRKVGESVLDWPASASEVTSSDYPF
jgi:SAM-dependent methyltransferase